MPATHDHWTVELLDSLPNDGQRYELIDGELYVTPAPSDVHQFVLGEFYVRLRQYLRPTSLARVIVSPADVRMDDHSVNRVQPDVFAVRLKRGKRPKYPYDLADLLLVVEIESPSTPMLDRQVKRALYLGEGVPEYWVVNVEQQTVTRWRGVDDEGETVSGRLEWRPKGMTEPLVIDIPALFREALG